jgi:hypothetical protein
MTTMRWILGGILVFFAGGLVVLSMVAGGFRKSFGASAINPLIVALPLIAFAVLFAGVLFPASRSILHAGAVAAVGLIGLCVWQIIADSAVVLFFGIAYLILWLIYYWIAAWKP